MSFLDRRFFRAAALVASLGSAVTAVGGAADPATGSVLPSYVWSGSGAAAGHFSWSTPANWGGRVPPVGTPDFIDFPVLSCTDCGSIAQSSNNITGLEAAQLSIGLAEYPSTVPYSYSITGKALNVDGLTVTTTTGGGPVGQGAFIGLPLALTGNESWSIGLEEGANLALAKITGTGTLDLTLPTDFAGGGFLDPGSWNVGALTLTTPSGSGAPDVLVPTRSLNGTSLSPVTLNTVNLFVSGGFNPATLAAATVSYGPLTLNTSSAQFGNGGGTGPYGLDKVNGALAVDSTSTLTFFSLEPGTTSAPRAGLDYPQLDATGPVTLSSPTLTLFAGCNQTIGTRYTFVKGSSITGRFNNAAQNSTIHANADQELSCTGGTAPWLKIHYGTTSITATVVSPPSAATATLTGRTPGHGWLVVDHAGRITRAS